MLGPIGGACAAAIACPEAPEVGYIPCACSAFVDGGCLEDMGEQYE